MSVFALLLTFDVDGEAPYIYRSCDYVQTTRGLYGVKVALRRILDLLDRYDVKASFMVCGYEIYMHPDEIGEILERGHEIGLHGFLHEDYSKLDYTRTEELIDRCIRIFREKLGVAPLGFRAPYWRMKKHLLTAISRRGIIWDSSLMDSDNPYIIELPDSRRLVEIPVAYILDDWILFEERSFTPKEILKMWISEIKWSIKTKTTCTLTFHPEVIGRRSRINVLRKILKYIRENDIKIFTGREIAEKTMEACSF